MKKEKTYSHNMKVEERYFASDVESMKQHDEKFKDAIESGTEYDFTIQLSVLYQICPRKMREKQQYKRFINYLKQKGITMKIVSRKRDRESGQN